MKFAASPPAAHGTPRKYSRLPDYCFKLPGHVNLEKAILLEPKSVAVPMSKVMNVSMEDPVVVLGAGTMGLLCGAVTRYLALKSDSGGYFRVKI